MEQAVWLYAGFVSALFGVVIIGFLVVDMQEKSKVQELENTINKLGQLADFVCSGDNGMLVSESVRLASGSKLVSSSAKNSICLTYSSNTKCVVVSCGIRDYALDLDTPEHKSAFNIANYRCYVEKEAGVAKLNCRG